MEQDLGVVVGVTGRHQNTDALRYAATTAAAEGCGVTLAHVGERAASVLRDVREELEALTHHALPVDAVTTHGAAGPALARVAARARLLVLQHRCIPPLRRAITGSTVTAAVAYATCPVASVPVGGVLREAEAVVACVHEDGGPEQVLRAAFTAAQRLGRPVVRVVHASRPPAAFDALRLHDHEWRARLEESLERLVGATPGVEPRDIQVVVRNEWPERVVLDASSRARLLVLGRHGGRGPRSIRVGTLARVAVQRAACPVLIVPV